MSNQDNNNGILCTICENNGYRRYNCTNDILVSDLQRIVDFSDNLHNHRNEIEQVLNNIREHVGNSYNQLDMLSLLAYMILKKQSKNTNLNSEIILEIKEMKDLKPEPFDCAVCLEKLPRLISLTFDCNHNFCGNCVITNIQKEKHIKPLQCYLCRHHVKSINIYDDKNIYEKLKEQIDT
jgi:hypothetical protein